MEKLKKVSTRGNFASLSCEAQEKYVKKKSCSGTPGVYINRSWGQKLVLGTLKNWPMSACRDTVPMLAKPSECILYSNSAEGGLG